MTYEYADVRWQCGCGRFISERVITQRDYRDPLSHYGVSTATSYICSRCGKVDGYPRLIETRVMTCDDEVSA